MRVSERSRRVLSHLCPRFVGRILYGMVLGLFRAGIYGRFLFQGRKPIRGIWARNSFLTNDFRPFISDLDITILFSSDADPSDFRFVNRFFEKFSRRLPIISECNFYFDEGYRGLVDCLNPIERQRDPRLSVTLNREPARECWQRRPVAAERTAFLLRMVVADSRRLREHPEMRKGKWRTHFEQCGRRSPEPFRLDTVLRAIFAGSAFDRETVCREIAKFLDARDRGDRFEEWTVNRSVIACLPHIFCHYDLRAFPLCAELAAIQEAQLRWEAWGLMSQWIHFSASGARQRQVFNDQIDRLRQLEGKYEFLSRLSALTEGGDLHHV